MCSNDVVVDSNGSSLPCPCNLSAPAVKNILILYMRF